MRCILVLKFLQFATDDHWVCIFLTCIRSAWFCGCHLVVRLYIQFAWDLIKYEIVVCSRRQMRVSLNISQYRFFFFYDPLFVKMFMIWGNCVSTLILNPNCDFTLIFVDFAFLPLLFQYEASVYPYS